MDIKEIETYLKEKNIQYEIIRQDKPILSALDAEGYYPVEKSAPTFVLQTENGLIGCITSIQNGRLDFEKMKLQFGYSKLKMADRKRFKAKPDIALVQFPLSGWDFPVYLIKNCLNTILFMVALGMNC